jgi:hypothetical protein
VAVVVVPAPPWCTTAATPDEVASQREYADDLLTLELVDGRRVRAHRRGHR